jgi:uncharacterized protein (DUF2235 family)
MGIKDLFQRWSKSRHDRAVAKVEAEAQMSPAERHAAQQDFEEYKDDMLTKQSYAASEAESVVEGELED